MTSAGAFIKRVKGKRIVNVELLKGAATDECGCCEFEFTLEDGYSFVG